ncbi:MAG TPA: hypothetical protein VF062_08480 [Candidatus Limnocylindrales bacterium]
MSDLFSQALDEFHAAEAVTPQPMAGSAEVRAKVAHRRRVRLTTLGVVGALAVVVPIGAFAGNPRGNNPPPNALGSTGPTVGAMSWQEHSSILTPAMLIKAKAKVPTGAFWEGCPAYVTTEIAAGTEPAVVPGATAYPNLDDIPDLETVAVLSCFRNNRMSSQVVAYDVDSNGAPVIMGAVFQPPEPNMILRIGERPNRQSGVLVTLAATGEEPNLAGPAVQEREFAWDGTAFQQVGGPTSFPPRRSGDLSITAGPFEFAPGTKQTGWASLTVKNKGSEPTPEITIQVHLETGMTLLNDMQQTKTIPGLRPGESTNFSVTVALDSTITGKDFFVGVHSYILDTNGEDNFAQVTINRP